jgi:hypothetical protein
MMNEKDSSKMKNEKGKKWNEMKKIHHQVMMFPDVTEF